MMHVKNSKRINKRTRFGVLAVTMCICMLLSSFGLSGCRLVNDITNGLKPAQKPVPEAELARLIATSIIYEDSVDDCYAKIPQIQLEDLSYSEFYAYCDILRSCSLKHGNAVSFKILDESEKSKYFSQIDSGGNVNYQSIDVYGDMDVVELSYDVDKDPSASPVRFTIAKNGDSYSVAGKYISDSMLAYYYINHYFEMIDDKNVTGLESLIRLAYDSDIYLNSVINAKADYITDYYRLKVKTNIEDYELKLFAPTHISYEIPEVFSEDGDSINSKNVNLRLLKNDSYTLEDDIPAIVDEIRFCKNQNNLLRMGSTYTASELYRLLGTPIVESRDPGLVVLSYKGLTLRLVTDDPVSEKWTSGRLSSVVLRNDETYSLGKNLYIGMNVSELLLIYPMLDEFGYTGSFENGDGEFILSFTFDDYGNITRIRLGEKID